MNYDEFEKVGGCRKCQHFRPFIDVDGNIVDDFPDECFSCYDSKTKSWNNFTVKILYLGSEEKKYNNNQTRLV